MIRVLIVTITSSVSTMRKRKLILRRLGLHVNCDICPNSQLRQLIGSMYVYNLDTFMCCWRWQNCYPSVVISQLRERGIIAITLAHQNLSSLPTGKGSHANPGLHAIRAGDWIAKVDLKDALFHAPTLKTGQRVSQILVQRPNLPVRVHVPLGSSPRP